MNDHAKFAKNLKTVSCKNIIRCKNPHKQTYVRMCVGEGHMVTFTRVIRINNFQKLMSSFVNSLDE